MAPASSNSNEDSIPSEHEQKKEKKKGIQSAHTTLLCILCGTGFDEWVQRLDEEEMITDTQLLKRIKLGEMQWNSSFLSSIENAKGFFRRYVTDDDLEDVATWAHDLSVRQREKRRLEGGKGDCMRAGMLTPAGTTVYAF